MTLFGTSCIGECSPLGICKPSWVFASLNVWNSLGCQSIMHLTKLPSKPTRTFKLLPRQVLGILGKHVHELKLSILPDVQAGQLSGSAGREIRASLGSLGLDFVTSGRLDVPGVLYRKQRL
mmetsp:Transcript_130430/g.260231  ORF Transcript_130430/g.260231 Transcript_130430/m.260231 type:complete len:121 (-) Transcript_130430:1082-1444(-)